MRFAILTLVLLASHSVDLAAQPAAAQPATDTPPAADMPPATDTPPAADVEAPPEVAPNAGSVQLVEVDSRPVRPSGFWTSTRPAQGGAYRYRLLGIGVAVMLMTLGFMLWVIRRKGQRTD